jgi:hypothetical protein
MNDPAILAAIDVPPSATMKSTVKRRKLSFRKSQPEQLQMENL